MKHILTVIAVAITLNTSAFAADWTVVSTSSTALKAEERTPFESDNFWLNIKLRNDSKVIQYVQGLGKWFMIEAFVRRQESGTWERQNTGVDRKLEWIAIKPGEEIMLRKGQSGADVGLPMMLTFSRALSAGDSTGSIVMLDQFIVPAPPKNP